MKTFKRLGGTMKYLFLGFLVLGFLVGCHTDQANVPVLIAPEDGTKLVLDWGDSAIFQWEAESEMIYFTLEISEGEEFYPFQEVTTRTYATIENPFFMDIIKEEDGVYSSWPISIFGLGVFYWRVFAYSEENEWSDPSKVWSFELVKE